MNNAVVTQQLFSGALSGFTSAIFLQPLDLLKTRVQQGDTATGTRCNTPLIWRNACAIVKNNGTLGLWRGTGATLIRNVPGVALYFTSLTHLRSIMARSQCFATQEIIVTRNHVKTILPQLTNQGNLIAGATARIAVGFLLNPFSVLKARFESEHFAYKSLTRSFISIARMGPSELMRGFVASSLRDAPYAGLFVVVYEAIKRESSKLPPLYSQEFMAKASPVGLLVSTAPATSIHSLSAAAAGAIATMATHPFDVIKTRMQVRHEDQYRGLLSTTSRVWQQRGVRGFFDGASLRMSRKVLSSAIGWAVFEGMLLFLQKQ